MRTYTNRMLLSITLLTPIVGTMTTCSVHAEASAQSESQKYVHEFFTGANNLDNGYTVAGLYDAVLKICEQADNKLAEEWKQISIAENPEKAADFLLNHKDTFKVDGTLLFPDVKADVLAKLKETVGWEFLERLLFSDDQEIITSYKNNGWDALVTDLRNMMAHTQYSNIAQAIPYKEEFTTIGSRRLALRRGQEVQNILTQHQSQFPETMQNRLNDKNTVQTVKERMLDLLA